MKDFKERLKELEAKQQEIEEFKDNLRNDALAEAKALVEQFGFTASDLGICCGECQEAPKKKARKPREPKYQNPHGPEKWTGSGRSPVWFTKALEEGITRDEMLIKKP